MLEDIKGVGPRMVETLKKMGIESIDDLINYYPFRYNFLVPTKLTTGNVVITGIIESAPIATYIKRNLNKLTFRMETDNYLVNVTLFNRAFMKNSLKRGQEITVIGEYDEKHNNINASDIRLKKLEGEVIEPVYHLTAGISSRVLHNFIMSALSTNPISTDYIPDYLQEEYDFLDKETALRLIHNPPSLDKIKNSILRLKYEEAFKFMFKINYLKKLRKKSCGLKREIPIDEGLKFIESLPFSLTNDQINAVKDILNDLKSPDRMNRLLLGDVGSGKTIVSVVAIYYNFLSGYQSALLAPTEILATQHFYNIRELFKTYGLRVEILKGGTAKGERKKIIESLVSGEIDLLIGTHAVLEEDVKFANLGLVITDEQHRFGVNQRSVFQNKGQMSDVLYMSATPIPRTYALTLYGDMDISMIKEKPAGRKEVITSLVKFKDIKKVLSAMLEEIKQNRQVYVVSPLIDENEENSLISVKKLKEKIDEAYNNRIPSEILHGKLKNEKKTKIMDDFRSGEIKILISTTVIEVGVDVPNATMMVIFNAERFGLATIHQLRGRIGRGNLEAKCILVSDKASERLKVLVESNDGFYISEQDFKMRGEGDLFGVRQSGDMVFKILDLRKDMKILTQANVDAAKFIEQNRFDNFKNYKEHRELARQIEHID